MAKLRAIWDDVADSLWFMPAAITLVCAALAILLINLNDRILSGVDPGELWWLFGGSAEGAQGVLGAIASSIITVTGVVFSVTIVALQLASSQFTPRVLRQFTADRANQIVLGVFIGTFTYTLLVQRTVRGEDGGSAFVPNVAVTGAVFLALTSIGFLIYFIDHAARSIQASVIIDSVTRDTLAVMRHVFPERVEDEHEPLEATADEYTAGLREAPFEVRSRDGGYVQAVEQHRLREIARQRQVLIRVDVTIGTYVLPGRAVLSVWPAADVRDDMLHDFHDALVFGPERTPHQDIQLGVIELMDMAVKAMSPSVNDPTTALHAADRLAEILLELSWRRRGDHIELAPDGRPLLLMPRPRLEETTALALNQIRHYAGDNPTVVIALMRLLAQLAVLCPEASRGVFIEQFRHVERTARRRISDPLDLERISAASHRALERAAGAEHA